VGGFCDDPDLLHPVTKKNRMIQRWRMWDDAFMSFIVGQTKGVSEQQTTTPKMIKYLSYPQR
jgi:hypothetical protein